MSTKTVLVQFQNELKPINLTQTKVSEVLTESRTAFSIDENTHLKLKFTDEDNDLITITLDEELNDALSTAKSEQDLLIFSLELVSSSSSVPMTQQVETTPTPVSTTTETQPETQHEVVETQTTETQTTTTGNVETEEKEEEKMEVEEKPELVSNEENQIRQVSNIQYLTNELQYHRLIAQTAVQAVFANLRKNYKEKAQPVITEGLDILNQKKDIVFEAVHTTIREWRQSIQPLPSAQEIANTVSNALKEAGHLAAPVIESIRTSIFKVLDLLLRKNPLNITEAEIEMVSNNVVEEAYQSSTSQKEDQEMENIMSKFDTESVVTGNEEKDIQIPSSLNNEDAFLVVENYRVHDDDPQTTQKRLRSATDASETVWEAPKEEEEKETDKKEQTTSTNETVIVEKETDEFENLELTKEIIQISEMGFSADEQRVRSLLKKHGGDIQAVVNELLS